MEDKTKFKTLFLAENKTKQKNPSSPCHGAALTDATTFLTLSRTANAASFYSSSGSQEIPTINKIRSPLVKCKKGK